MPLKNRNQQIPNGMTFLQPQTGFKPVAWSSFDSIVMQVIAHRKGNPHLAMKHRWATDVPTVEKEVDAFNTAICKANHWDNFLTAETPSPSLLPPRRSLAQSLGAAVGGVKRSMVGIKVVSEWLGSGLKPVEKPVAEKRASVCVACPLNQDGGFWEKMDAKAAAEVKSLVEVKSDLQLSTSQDDKLRSCTACLCWNPLKVWVPIKHILSNSKPDELKRLDKSCWVLSESKP